MKLLNQSCTVFPPPFHSTSPFSDLRIAFTTAFALIANLPSSLALAQLYLVVACLFRPGAPGLRLFESDESDVIPIHDLILPSPKLNSEGVRVKVV